MTVYRPHRTLILTTVCLALAGCVPGTPQWDKPTEGGQVKHLAPVVAPPLPPDTSPPGVYEDIITLPDGTKKIRITIIRAHPLPSWPVKP